MSRAWVQRQFIIVGTPQQNGVFERKNKTLIGALYFLCYLMPNYLKSTRGSSYNCQLFTKQITNKSFEQ